jgi:hypothetical protein
LTVCAAAAFAWVYDADGKDIGSAIVAIADRMLTDEGLGIAYESQRFKASMIGNKMILVAGPTFIHSQLLRRLSQVLDDEKELAVSELADAYARLILDYTREQASDIYLSPLGLSVDTFKIEQKSLDPALVADITRQLQGHRIDGNPEAIVIGCEDRRAGLYHVNGAGLVTCHDDIGFISIGNGGIHASGHFMLQPHSYQSNFFTTLLTVYAAKKRAEVAPGVGKMTDMFLLTSNGVEKLDDEILAELARRYEKRVATIQRLDGTDSQEIGHFYSEHWKSRNPRVEPVASTDGPEQTAESHPD